MCRPTESFYCCCCDGGPCSLKLFDRDYNLISWIIRHFHFPGWYSGRKMESSTRDCGNKAKKGTHTRNICIVSRKKGDDEKRTWEGEKVFTHLRLLSISFQTIKSISALVYRSPPPPSLYTHAHNRIVYVIVFTRNLSSAYRVNQYK